MDLRQVVVFIRQQSSNRSPSRTVSVALEGLDVVSQSELAARGFVSEGDYAVIQIMGDNSDRMHQVLRDLEHWIVSWAEKQGAQPIFRWRVIPG